MNNKDTVELAIAASDWGNTKILRTILTQLERIEVLAAVWREQSRTVDTDDSYERQQCVQVLRNSRRIGDRVETSMKELGA